MALCTQCGALLHDLDANSHVCDEADKPEKGKPIKKGKTKLEADIIA